MTSKILISDWFGRGESSLFLSIILHLEVKIGSFLPKHPLWQWKLSSPNCNLTRMWQSPPVYAIMTALKQMTRVLSQCCWTFILRDLCYWNSARLCICTSHLASDNVLYQWWPSSMLCIPFSLRCCCFVVLIEVKRDIYFCHETVHSNGNDCLFICLLVRAQSSWSAAVLWRYQHMDGKVLVIRIGKSQQ